MRELVFGSSFRVERPFLSISLSLESLTLDGTHKPISLPTWWMLHAGIATNLMHTPSLRAEHLGTENLARISLPSRMEAPLL